LPLGSGEPRLEAKEAGLSTTSLRAGTQMGVFPQGVGAGLGGSEGWSWVQEVALIRGDVREETDLVCTLPMSASSLGTWDHLGETDETSQCLSLKCV
jgi:hypothetical protein